MTRESQYKVALEFDYPQKLIDAVLRRHNFTQASDLLAFLDNIIDNGEEDEYVKEEEQQEVEPEAAVASPPQETECKGDEKKEEEKEEEEVAPASDPPRPITLREETEELYKNSICLRCFARRRCFVSLPCCHLSLCDKCERSTTHCPMRGCNEKIECVIETFM